MEFKGLGKRYFMESLTEAIMFLIKNCYFTIGNMVFKQDTEIPVGTIKVLSEIIHFDFKSKV